MVIKYACYSCEEVHSTEIGARDCCGCPCCEVSSCCEAALLSTGTACSNCGESIY